MSQLESELLTRTELEKRFAEDEAKYRQEAEKLTGPSLIVEDLKRDITQLEDFIGPMDRQLRELQVEMSRPASRDPNHPCRIRHDGFADTGRQAHAAGFGQGHHAALADPESSVEDHAAALAGWLLIPLAFILFRLVRWIFSFTFSSGPHLPGPTPHTTPNT